ncbi:MAG: hypothetical protein Q4F83_03385 [Eubacteriales bacterium]|nr:hypothetical protein [Eubacteriales bacterium]
MKRKYLAVVLALSMSLTPYAAFAAEDAAETSGEAELVTETSESAEETDGSDVSADELMKKQAEFAQNSRSVSADMDMNFDLDFLVSLTGEDDMNQDYGFSMKMNGDMKVDMMMAPMTAAVTGTMTMEMDTESETIDMSSYMVTSEDGTKMDIYSKNPENDGQWTHTQTDLTEILKQLGVSSLNDLQALSSNDIMKDAVTWEVKENDSAYELTGQLKFGDMADTILPIIEQSVQSSMSAAGQEMDMAVIEPIVTTVLDCFVINTSYTLDKETCAVQTAHIDFNDSDLSAITALIQMYFAAFDTGSENKLECNIELNDFTIDAVYTYDEVSEIVVPEEALNAETIDLNEIMSEASEAVEE